MIRKIVSVSLLILLIAASCPLDADVPVHYFCGGAVEYSANAWWQQPAPNTARSGIQQLDGPPRTCPEFSSNLMISGGVGDITALPQSIPGGGTIDNDISVYHSVTPSFPFGNVGALGQMLGRMFFGPQYAPTSRKMSAELGAVRSLSKDMTNALAADAEFAKSQIPTYEQQVNVEASALHVKVTDLKRVMEAQAQVLSNTLRARPPMPQVVPNTELDSVLRELEQRRSIAEISGAIPLENLRSTGRSIFGSLDQTRASVFSNKSLAEQSIQRERNKLTAAMSSGAEAPGSARLLARSEGALSMATRYAQSNGEAARPFAEALINEARSYRYVATGRMSDLRIATMEHDGSLSSTRLAPNGGLPPDSLDREFASFNGSVVLIEARLADTRQIIQARTGADRQESEQLSADAFSMLANAENAYFSGLPAEANVLISASTQINIAVRDDSFAQPALDKPANDELVEFGKTLYGEASNAATDKVIGELGRVFTKIEDLDPVSGIVRDLTGFNVALARLMNQPNPEDQRTVVELAVNFGIGLTATSLAQAFAVAFSLSAGWAGVLAISAAVAAHYMTLALINIGSHPPSRAPSDPDH